MQTVFFAFILFSVVMVIMSIGVILGRKPITGSCGGLGAALGETDKECEFCGGDPNRCESPSSIMNASLEITRPGVSQFTPTTKNH